MAKKSKDTLGIAKVLDKLKDEFSEIEKASEGKEGKYGFDVKEVEIELQFTVSKKGKGGVNLGVVEVGGEYEKEQVQKIKLVLDPYKIEKGLTDSTDPEWERWKEDGGYNQHLRKPISLKKASRKSGRISLKKRAVAKRKATAKRKAAKRKATKRRR